MEGSSQIKLALNESNDPVIYSNKELSIIPHRQNPPWRIPTFSLMGIQAFAQDKQGNKFEIFSDGKALPKGCKLFFYPKYNNARQYYIKWQITNTGREANNEGCLRGDFYSGDLEKNGREESTSYTGSHIVQCFAIYKNNCIAKSKEFIVNIE